MRILHVIPTINPAGGGPMEAVTRLGVEYIRQGNHVEVVTLDRPSDEWVAKCPLKTHALGPAYLKYGYTPRFVPWLRENTTNFDVVVINGVWQYTSFGVWRALRGSHRPYAVFTHGMLDPWFKRRYPLKHIKKWMYWPWAEYRVLRDAHAVLFTSEEERVQARRSFWLYRCSERVINYGTAEPPNGNGSTADRFREAFPSVGDKRIVLFLGRIHEKKGCDLLVRAFGSLVKDSPYLARSWHLVFAGPDASVTYRGMLERLIQKTCPDGAITWTGLLTGDQKWAAFRAADVFILPSHHENFGIAVAEALACGVPVLVSNQVNIWREIDADGAGFVEQDDVDGTRRLLERWITLDDAAKTRMRDDAVRCFATRFNIRNTARQFTAALETLA